MNANIWTFWIFFEKFKAFWGLFNHILVQEQRCKNILQPPNGHVGMPQIPVSCSHQNCKHFKHFNPVAVVVCGQDKTVQVKCKIVANKMQKEEKQDRQQ